MRVANAYSRAWMLLGIACLLAAVPACTAAPTQTVEPPSSTLKWKGGPGTSLQQPSVFYGSTEAIRIAETVLPYQSENGGWPKNYDRIAELSESDKQQLLQMKGRQDTTFDNGSTHTEAQRSSLRSRAQFPGSRRLRSPTSG